MNYDGVRIAVGLAAGSSEWASIKSSGRQGVARAFAEGGARKAKVKLEKMLAARSVQAPPAAVAARAQKKRRRRENARERVVANGRGVLTDAQLFSLFALERGAHQRVRGFLDSAPVQPQRRHPERKAQLRAMWAAEFARFCDDFVAHYRGTRDERALTQFTATAAAVVRVPPDEAAAASLWHVLAAKNWTGVRFGCAAAEVPIGEQNVGHRMLVAMGWQEGAGLGKGEHGIVAPLVCGGAQTSRSGLGFKRGAVQRVGVRKRKRAQTGDLDSNVAS